MRKRIPISLTLNNSYDINHKISKSNIIKRPESARERYPYISKTQLIKKNNEYSIPNNKRITRGLGKSIEKEELYENSIQLKILVNKLKKELNESKSIINQKDIELKKKNKIINDCLKDNDIDEVHKVNLEKGKESNLLSLCKEKYYEMKNNYKKKCEENNILKANIKLTKIKEIQIETEILKNELEKMKSLYLNSLGEIKSNNLEINNLKEFKDKFLEQHNIINCLNKKNDELNKTLLNEISKFRETLEKNKKENKKLKVEISKLKILNEKYLNEKVLKENKIRNENDNERQLNNIKEQLNEYKKLYEQSSKEIQNLTKMNKNNFQIQNPLLIKPIDKNIYKSISQNPNEENEKIKLLKNIIKTYKIKIIIYEEFLQKNNYKINKILEEGKYNNGLINEDSPLKRKIIKNQESSKSSTSKKENKSSNSNNNIEGIGIINDFNSKVSGFPLVNDNYISNNNTYKISNNISNNFNENDNFNSDINDNKNNIYDINNEFNSIPEVDEESPKNIPYLIRKNIEDYNNKNENELFNNIKNSLSNYSYNLINELKEHDIKKDYIITFGALNNIFDKLKININDDDLEFLIYKMKVSVPKNHSMNDLNYFIIENMFNENNDKYYINNINDIIKEENESLSEEEINNLFIKLKNSINEKNENFNDDIIAKNTISIECFDKKYNGIKKENFFNILKEHDIEIEDNKFNNLYEKFKIEENYDNIEELFDIKKIRNWYNKN